MKKICLIVFLAQICLLLHSSAQSVFNSDSVNVNNTVFYITHSGKYNLISTDKRLVHPKQLQEALTDSVGYIEGDFINRAELGRAYSKLISPKRAFKLAQNPEMILKLLFNKTGSVSAVTYVVSPYINITAPDLLTIDSLVKSTIKISLPESLKHYKRLEPYVFQFSFLEMTAYREEIKLDSLHTDWMDSDITLLTRLTQLDKSNPHSVVDFFGQITEHSWRKDTLGFGWTHINTGKGAGYLSVNLDYYTYNNKIMSYTLSSRLPYRHDLLDKYNLLLHSVMPIDSGNVVYYKFREDRLLKPVAAFYQTSYNKHLPLQLLKYMSPMSGTMYGYSGGLPVSTLTNRKMFNQVSGRLSNNQIITLMYSINPASRLTAIEYYYRHRERFKNYKGIERWIKTVYAQNSTLESISGCLVYSDTPEKLVKNYLSFEEYLIPW